MKRSLLVLLFGLLTVSLICSNFAQAQYTARGTVTLAPSTPLLTAVDPYANPDKANSLNPTRPFWYAADASGLKIMKLADNTVLGTVAWPATISLAQPNGTMATVAAPPAGWEPVRLMVPFPGSEDIGPEALEGARTVAFVVMAHSGFEWRTSDGRFRDMIVPMTSEDTESSMMVMIEVSDPANPVVFAGAILGHDAGQMTWDPNMGSMYVANMPSKSLPAHLESFVSKITAPETGAEPPAPFTPKTLYPLCGKEIEWSGEVKVVEKLGVPVGAPEVWACDTIHGAGEGEGPFEYEFTGLPAWLVAHLDPVTGKPDGILYGTPTEVGIYTFVAKVIDHGGDPSLPAPTASAVVSVEVKLSVMEFAAGEMEVEAGTVTAMPVWGTATSTCETTPGKTEVPPWFQILTVPNGCIFIMNSPTLSGEYYNFVMPNLTRIDPRTGVSYPGPWVVSAEVLGTYGFDTLPPGVGLSGIAWHEVDMIPGEPDKYVLNGEFVGIDAMTGQLYRFITPYEESDTIEEVGPPSLVVETNEIATEGLPLLEYLKSTRSDVADAVTADPTLKVFGDLVVEADGDIFVSVPIANSAGLGGAVIKVSGGTPSTINLPGVQATYLALDSDLEPAVKPELGGIGQIDHGVLWATGPGSGSLAVINTAAGTLSQTLPVAGASSLGSVATDSISIGLTYVAGQALQNVTIFGAGIAYETVPQIGAIGTTLALVDPPTTMTVGEPDEFTVVAAAWPVPQMSATGTLPPGLVAVDNGNGTLTVSGTPTTAGTYPFTAVATNTRGTASMEFTFTINGLAPPVITSANTATLPVGVASQFKFEATGMPNPIFTFSGALPAGVTFHDNAACAPLIPGGNCTGSAFLGGLPTSTGTYPLTVTATNSQGSVTQEFTLIIGENATPATAPAITSAPETTFSLGFATAFTVTTTGNPKPTLSYSGALPSGVTFTDNYNGTATLTGTTTAGNYPLTILATNGVSPAASQNFTLRVMEPLATAPTITSGNVAAFTVGKAETFTVTTTGWPLATLSLSGTLPGGVNFTDNRDGTATLAGSPAAEGTYPLQITAANGVLLGVTQKFTLTTQFGQVKKITTVGLAPESIAVDPGQGTIYVGSFQPQPFAPAIYMLGLDKSLNTLTNSVMKGSILPNLGRQYYPYDANFGVNPNNHILYQSQGTLHQVLVFDPIKSTQLGRIDFGLWEPTGIAVDEKRSIIYIGAKAPLVEADEGGDVSKCKVEPGDNAPGDEECRRVGAIWVFDGRTPIPTLITKIPAGDDPESVVFNPKADKVYAANEDDGTVTIARGVQLLHTPGHFAGGDVIKTLKVFSNSVCAGWDRAEEADKLAVDPENNYVYITDDKYRVAKISGAANKVLDVLSIGTRGKDFQCANDLPLLASSENGANSANNIAISSDRKGNVRIYITSEQDFITMIDPKTFQIVSTIRIPDAIHLDGIAVLPESNAVFVTDEWAQMFEIRGQCAKGVASACTLVP